MLKSRRFFKSQGHRRAGAPPSLRALRALAPRIILLLLVNAVALRREFSILFNRVAIFILLYSGIIGYDSLYVTYLDTGIGIYNGLFHSTAITPSPQGGGARCPRFPPPFPPPSPPYFNFN